MEELYLSISYFVSPLVCVTPQSLKVSYLYLFPTVYTFIAGDSNKFLTNKIYLLEKCLILYHFSCHSVSTIPFYCDRYLYKNYSHSIYQVTFAMDTATKQWGYIYSLNSFTEQKLSCLFNSSEKCVPQNFEKCTLRKYMCHITLC